MNIDNMTLKELEEKRQNLINFMGCSFCDHIAFMDAQHRLSIVNDRIELIKNE